MNRIKIQAAEGGFFSGLYFASLNGDCLAGRAYFPPVDAIGIQTHTVDFPSPMRKIPVVLVSWRDNEETYNHVDMLTVKTVTDTSFTVLTKRKIITSNWNFSWVAIVD